VGKSMLARCGGLPRNTRSPWGETHAQYRNSHAELRKPDLEVTACYLNEVEAVQHVHLTNIPVWFRLLGNIKDGRT